MRTASNELISLLQSSTTFYMGEIYTFTLADGTILKNTSLDVDISYNGNNYASGGVLLKRGKISLTRGTQVDQLEIEAYPGTTGIGALSFLAAVKDGALDGAWVQLDRLFYSSFPPTTPVGAITLFYGKVGEVEVGRTMALIKVPSILELLNVQWPIHVYQQSCGWPLYSAGCGVNKTSQTGNGVVQSASSVSVINTNLPQGNNYWDQGVITFTSGNALGISRTIKSFLDTSNQVTVILPLPCAPSANDAFNVYPGCNKTLAACANRFFNSNNFRAFPFVPVPETGT